MRHAVLQLILLVLPSSAFAWGGRLHMDINRAAAKAVPEEMAAWRDYDKLLSRYAIHPDLWKEGNKSESPRHYLDVERYRDIGISNLPPVYARVAEMSTWRVSPGDGIAPWVIVEAERNLSLAMASNDWTLAVRWAAALGHYVGDIHQPLHTTENFDGAKVPGSGTHLRWEDGMPKVFWRSSLLTAGTPEYLKDPWASVLEWVGRAHARYRDIYAADEAAIRSSGGNTESRAYYNALWEGTRELFISQANRAATDLASLWYTAWMDAGRPAIPSPPDDIPKGSVWQIAAASPAPSAMPFFVGFCIVAVVVVVLSMRKKK
ncbi:MAG: hypothetical protein BWK77_04065 [Verrucomicrobia bacterium A1]|nr:MAG: hypothetical protein BWK77_04065 [Verrucomicrobia bacterium A1]